MPLVRIALRKGTKPEFRRAVSDSIHRAMVETIKIPEQDKFQVITEHDADLLIYDPAYLGISRSDGVVFSSRSRSAPAARWRCARRCSRGSRRSCASRPASVPRTCS